MQKVMLLLFTLLVLVGFSSNVRADNIIIPAINITPGSPHFEAHDSLTNPPAWVYPNNPDVWTFNFSGFSGSQLLITLFVSDWYSAYPDDYNVYWDNSLLGNTLNAAGRTFSFNTSQATHTLKIDYVNLHSGASFPPDSGGSYYNLDLTASAAPLPSTLCLLGPALMGLLWFRKR